jgi:hypothetical protein
MNSAIRKLKIQSLNRQLEASRLNCESISCDLEGAADPEMKASLASRLRRAKQEANAVQLALALLEGQEQATFAEPNPAR